MASGTKVLFLAMDAGDTVLIRKWAADGTLKTLRALLEKGLVGATASLEGFFEGATWPSFYTGATPAHHGFHRLIQLRPGTYDFQRCHTGEFLKREPFWDYLSEADRRVAILDVPLSAISGKINGIQVVEWGGHDPDYGFSTHPRPLKQEVVSRFGAYPVQAACDSVERTAAGFSAFRDRLLQGVRQKTKLTKEYLHGERWDFFAQVFTESHCVGHQCWHLHDANHPSHDPGIAAAAGDPLRDVYVAIDAAMGEILATVDDDTVVVFLASHRMAHNYGAEFLLPEILTRLGVSQAIAPTAPPPRPDRTKGGLDAVLAWGWHHLPEAVKDGLKPVRDGVRGVFDRRHPYVPASLSGLDVKKSRCFPLDNGFSVGGIRVNLAGREPDGIVEPGSGLDAFCDELARDLLEIVDADTGTPMIKGVKRTAALYEGEQLHHLPDLLVEWNDKKPVGSTGAGNPAGSTVRMSSGKIGIVEGVNTYCRTGDHRADGLFVAFGGGIEPGDLGRTVSLMDFAPTFTRLLGVEMPNVDGRPIAEIVKGGDRVR